VQSTKKFYNVVINYNYCKRCGICSWICPVKAIVEGEFDIPQISDPYKCIGCLQCERMCPDFAIDVRLVD